MTSEGAVRQRQEITRLRSLVDSFGLLSSSLDLDQVLANTLRRACELTRATAGSIALVNDERSHLEFVESTDSNREKLKELRVPIDRGIAGHVARTGRPVRVADCYQDERFYDQIDQVLGTRTRTYLCVPLTVDGIVIGTTQIMNRDDGQSFDQDDEDLLVGFSGQAALAIRNARYHELALLQKQIDSELRLCARIQAHLFPRQVPRVEGWEVFGSCVPSRKVSGDYYTYLRRPDGSVEAILADVSGKGLSAALTVSELHSAVHVLGGLDRSIAEWIATLDEHLVGSLVLGQFVTFFAVRFQADGDDVEYVCAGHPPPRIVDPDGAIRSLRSTGPILGPLPVVRNVESATDRIAPGEILVAFTDGYSEAERASGELFGIDGILDVVGRHRCDSLAAIREAIDMAVERFLDGDAVTDDMSLLLLRRLADG